MEFAAWCYPWDLLDEGVENVADRLETIGVSEVNLATNYHHVQAFLPHNPKRRTLFARASSYFQPNDGYGRLTPVPYEGMNGNDWLETIGDAITTTDLTLNSWTVGCHNSRLGLEYPDATLQTPHGDSLAFGLCPSNPNVQEYLRSLLADLDERASFERIELESFDYFHGRGFGWHHDKFHTDLGHLGEFLFGLCFCDHCQAIATSAGVDTEAARETCVATIDAIAEGTLPADFDLASWFCAHPNVIKYTAVRTDTLADLFAEFRAIVDADLGYYAGLISVADTWMQGADLSKLSSHLDFITITAYESSTTAVLDELRTARTLSPDAELHVGILPGHPAIHDPKTVAEMVDVLADEDVPRISFYNYGLLPERNLDWVANATELYR
ncbi:hypothetical protein ACFFQF_17795 [Haladaptatus pallidirubidus]|uniref:Uncharacterized protein n=1 Tax=Haladaptatus pallidirubidus TaxID=1008152 RepID=A0AAV3UR45_9EURY|nr:hypothetical protein [Haladaptatus pallidirubidus]